MFTGIIAEVGRVLALAPRDDGARLEVSHSRQLGEGLEVGSSLAVHGVCLTVMDQSHARSSFDLSPETLRRTTLRQLQVGAGLNLEPPLRLADPLGGHLVAGHVDAEVVLLKRYERSEHAELWFELPRPLARFVAEKGSVALDGVSLTAAALGNDRFQVALVPHTLEVTTFGNLREGDSSNLEVDLVARYLESIAEASEEDSS